MNAYLTPSLVFGFGIALAYELFVVIASAQFHQTAWLLYNVRVTAPVAAAVAAGHAVAFGLGMRSRGVAARRLGRVLLAGFVLSALVGSAGWLIRDPLSPWVPTFQAVVVSASLAVAFMMGRSRQNVFAF
jgi:hypothetical protein